MYDLNDPRPFWVPKGMDNANYFDNVLLIKSVAYRFPISILVLSDALRHSRVNQVLFSADRVHHVFAKRRNFRAKPGGGLEVVN
jgi:hypothetical protein